MIPTPARFFAGLPGLGLLLFLVGAPTAAQTQTYDVLIVNGRVIDGTGNPAFRADVGILGDQIVAMGRLEGTPARRTVDARGLYVVPGFIDLHSHANGALAGDDRRGREAHSLLTQGVTTVIGGADGFMLRWPITEEAAAYRYPGTALNVALMLGHNTIRREVMGDDYEREATPEEIARMERLVRAGMESGAWGMGAGLEYRPSRFSAPEEVLALARVLADYDGFYISHQRSEASIPLWQRPSMVRGLPIDGVQGLEETINVARQTGIRVVASHHKARGRSSFGRSLHDIRIVSEARDLEGLDVYLDVYPYETFGGGPRVMVPRWAMAPQGFDRMGGDDDPRLRGALEQHRENLRRNLADPGTRALIERDIAWEVDHNGGPDRLYIVDHPDPALLGRRMDQLSAERGVSYIDLLLEFALESGHPNMPGGAGMRGLGIWGPDIDNFYRQDFTATASDAGLMWPGAEERPGAHPRAYGAFVRRIAHYVKDRGVTTLPHAIRSSTSLPAQIIGLKDRGVLRPGFKADVVIFDYDRLRDHATLKDPHRYSEGIEYVLVNGEFALDRGRVTGALPGVVLAKESSRSSTR
jgi:N-acyl-D-amino-acid deacylase